MVARRFLDRCVSSGGRKLGLEAFAKHYLASSGLVRYETRREHFCDTCRARVLVTTPKIASSRLGDPVYRSLLFLEHENSHCHRDVLTRPLYPEVMFPGRCTASVQGASNLHTLDASCPLRPSMHHRPET
jgi:hypothetical protein